MKKMLRLALLAALLAVVLASCGSVAGSAPADTPADGTQERWRPEPGLSWQWQLSGRVNTGYNVDVYDVDAVETPASTVAGLHADGSKVVCYISAGSWENWRPDAKSFPEAVKGKPLDGWPGERWLDVRKVGTLRPIMERRMDVCQKKGFDAVEPDNIDGYANGSGFPLTYGQQIAYNRMLANAAHERGLAIALKNDTDQVKALVPYFDFAIVEECFAYKECDRYSPFVRAGKAVFLAEYRYRDVAAKCRAAGRQNLSLIFKKLDLNAWRRAC